ncbi:hypothetical protein [Sulfurimonas sp. HSL-1716]|uniref:hypothetical protein n=1 Tax=Hydrocurvibacter sulfurireducens TaxID=3131937 RepID=UPI0031F9C60E
MMRMNYKNYPTDYIRLLKTERTNGRKKARCFQEYWDDMEHGDHNSFRFYAKSWEVSTSTAHDWIKEFNHEIELFLSHWTIKNRQHYSYAKNQAERLPNESNTYKPKNIGFSQHSAERLPNEDINLNDNNAREDKKGYLFSKEFNDLYFIYGVNTKFKGKKEDAYQEFKRIDIDLDLLKLAAMRHLHDKDLNGKTYNLTNFLANEIYISYLPKKMKLTIDGVERIGLYDNDTMQFTSTTDKFIGQLTAKRLIELYQSKQLEFING